MTTESQGTATRRSELSFENPQTTFHISPARKPAGAFHVHSRLCDGSPSSEGYHISRHADEFHGRLIFRKRTREFPPKPTYPENSLHNKSIEPPATRQGCACPAASRSGCLGEAGFAAPPAAPRS